MSVLFILLVVSIVLAGGFLAGFAWAVKSGQFDDTCTPAMRIVSEQDHPVPSPSDNKEDTPQA